MKIGWIPVLLCAIKIGCVLALLGSASPAAALGGAMESATVRSMRKVVCTDDLMMERHALVPNPGAIPANCTEYELRTGRVSYTIHPRHEILLQLGGEVAIRLAGNELLLRSPGAPKEIRCDVLSMTLRSDADKKEKNVERERENRPQLYSPRRCTTEAGIETTCGEEAARR